MIFVTETGSYQELIARCFVFYFSLTVFDMVLFSSFTFVLISGRSEKQA